MEQVDPITVEIIRSQLLSIPNQIDGNIMRTAYSPLVYEFKDYAVGLVDPEGKLIAQSKGGIPIFIANALGIAVQDGLAVHGRDGIHPGDVIISNHGATLGQHLNNVVMYTPVYAGEGELVAFMAVLVHWLDIGGIVPGSCLSNDTTDIYQEGIQFRSVKLWSRGERVDDMYRMIEVNSRFPAMVLGDVDAQLAACLKGAAMAEALYARYGAGTVRAAITRMWDQSEAAAQAAIDAMPDGEYRASTFLDSDGRTPDQAVPIDVVVRVEGDKMTVDFSGVADQVAGPLNSGRDGGAVTAARVAFKYLTNPDEPANEGSFRPLDVEIPDGKFLSAAADAPMGAYSAPLPTVIDVILRAMAPAVPERTAAGHHATFCAHAFFGRNPKTGELFNHLEGGLGGWGAIDGADGAGTFKTMAHGDTLDVPAEVQEALYPLRLERMELRPDSGGPGRWRGSVGMEKHYEILAPCTLVTTVERTEHPAWGVAGGDDARGATVFVERVGQDPVPLLKGQMELQPGDRVRTSTGGGGGFGPATERPAVTVARDVAFGYVTREAARQAYLVAIREDGSIDEVETATLRAAAAE